MKGLITPAVLASRCSKGVGRATCVTVAARSPALLPAQTCTLYLPALLLVLLFLYQNQLPCSFSSVTALDGCAQTRPSARRSTSSRQPARAKHGNQAHSGCARSRTAQIYTGHARCKVISQLPFRLDTPAHQLAHFVLNSNPSTSLPSSP